MKGQTPMTTTTHVVMTTDEELTKRTIKIIEKSGRILLRKKSEGAHWIPEYWYLHCWTSIPAGPDHAVWGQKKNAMEFFNLKWALTIAPLYGCKVVVAYPETEEETNG